jgi:hypothetical protein
MKNPFVLFIICFSVSLAADAPQNKFGEFYPVSLFESQTSTAAVKSDEGFDSVSADASVEKPLESFERLKVKLQKGDAVLAAVWDAFDREYAEARERSASTGRDVEFAARGLRTLASHSLKIYARDPAAAEALMAQINTRLKPLLDEFKPNAPYRRVFSNLPSGGLSSETSGDSAIPRDLAENQANNIYNIRQNALRSFFIGMKRLRAFYPELQRLDARIDAVDDPRLDEILQSTRKK